MATVLLLVVMALGYGGIVYGGNSQIVLFLVLDRGYSAGTVFAITAWGGVVASVAYLINAFFGDRFERKYTQLFGAIVFAGGYWGMYESHSTAAVATFFIVSITGGILWLWSMYVYIPNNYPTRMRSLGTGWTDGIGHLGAWGGVLIAGQLFTVGAPRGFFLFVTIPCAILPGPPDRDLRQAPAPPRAGGDGPLDAGPPAGGRRLFPEVSPAAQGVSGGPARPAAGSAPVRQASLRRHPPLRNSAQITAFGRRN